MHPGFARGLLKVCPRVAALSIPQRKIQITQSNQLKFLSTVSSAKMNYLRCIPAAAIAATASVLPGSTTQASADISQNPQHLTAIVAQSDLLNRHAHGATLAFGSAVDATQSVQTLPEYVRISQYSLPEGHMDSFRKIDITRRFNGGKHFIGTLLRKPGGVEVHEQWLNPDTRELLVKVRLGESAVGHPGIVHGGATATILNNAFGMLFFSCNLGTGFTANLNIDYRAPLPAGTDVMAHLTVDGVHGSKVHMRAVFFNPDKGTVYAQARCLFIAKHVSSSAQAVGALQRYLRQGLASGAKVVKEAPNGARDAEEAAAAGR